MCVCVCVCVCVCALCDESRHSVVVNASECRSKGHEFESHQSGGGFSLDWLLPSVVSVLGPLECLESIHHF